MRHTPSLSQVRTTPVEPLYRITPDISDRERPLVSDWKFIRGDFAGAYQPDFSETGWRVVDLPHDWSIEDLPPAMADPLFCAIKLSPGDWSYSSVDDVSYSSAGVDVSEWSAVKLPRSWASHSAAGDAQRTGWYRRSFSIPDASAGKTVVLQLGIINGQETVWVDGEQISDTAGGFFSNSDIMNRAIELPGRLSFPGRHSIAVRISGPADGGFVSVISSPTRPSPCDPARSAGNISTGYAVGGIGWYRKHFTLRPGDRGKCVRICFDGSYMLTTVWINGIELGTNCHGYSCFGFDLSPHLNRSGKENIIAVKVVNLGRNSRWYTGSGLYRPVHLQFTESLRIAPWGVIVTTPKVNESAAAVNINVSLLSNTNSQSLQVRVRLLDDKKRLVCSVEQLCFIPDSTAVAELHLDVSEPSLWSPDTPILYHAEVAILSGERITDIVTIPFGIRSLAWDARRGFSLNGKTIKLRGGCIHHDFGPLGAAAFPMAERRRVETLKKAGFNAIRCSHNMPSSAFLQACDQLGMMVIDEAFDMWNIGKNPGDFSVYFKTHWQREIDAMVHRDRNHPCVIMWSIGNEIPERFDRSGVATAKMLAEHVRALDPTRPVTAAFNGANEKADPFFSALDIAGYNYSPQSFVPDNSRHPQRVMFTAESYPGDALRCWSAVESLPYVIGDFVWTAWDYRGEAGLGHSLLDGQASSYLLGWPNQNAYCGDFDSCGFVKPQSLYRQVLWGARPLAILVCNLPHGQRSKPDLWGWHDEQPSWSWAGSKGLPREIRVYARGRQVRLSLNGKLVGIQDIDQQLTATFTIPYQPGELTAEVLEDERTIARDSLVTAGRAVAFRLHVENRSIPAETLSIAFVQIEAIDANGRLVPTAADLFQVGIEGVGTLAALGNADPRNVGSVQQPAHALWQGRALLVVRSTGMPGSIGIRASAPGLGSADTVVQVIRIRE